MAYQPRQVLLARRYVLASTASRPTVPRLRRNTGQRCLASLARDSDSDFADCISVWATYDPTDPKMQPQQQLPYLD